VGAFISVFLVRSGASSFEVGLLTSLPAILTVFLAIPTGVYVERHKDVVRLTTWTLFITRLVFLVVALLPLLMLIGPWAAKAVIWGTVIVWGLSAIPSAIANTGWTAAIAATIPPRRRPAVNGLRWGLLSLLSAASVAVFGKVLDILPFPYNYQLVFGISFVASLLSTYYFSLIRLPKAAHPNRPTSARLPLVLQVKGFVATFTESKDFLRFSVSAFVYRWGLHLPIALYSIYWVNHLHAPDTLIGLRSTIEQITLALAYYIWGRIATAKGFYRVMLISSAGYALHPILTGVVPTMEWLLPVAVVSGFFAGGIDVSFFEALLKTCPEDKRASFVAMNSFLANVSAFLAPLAGAAISDALGIRTAFFLGGGFLLVGVVLFYLLPTK
jgi:MFS family permease